MKQIFNIKQILIVKFAETVLFQSEIIIKIKTKPIETTIIIEPISLYEKPSLAA